MSSDLIEENSLIREEEISHRMTGTLNSGQGTKSSGSPKQVEFAGERTLKKRDAEREREFWRSAEGCHNYSEKY